MAQVPVLNILLPPKERAFYFTSYTISMQYAPEKLNILPISMRQIIDK